MGGLRFGLLMPRTRSLPPTLPAARSAHGGRHRRWAPARIGSATIWCAGAALGATSRNISELKFISKIDANYEPWTMLGNLAFGCPAVCDWACACSDAGQRNPAVTAQAAATLRCLPEAEPWVSVSENMVTTTVEWTKPVAVRRSPGHHSRV